MIRRSEGCLAVSLVLVGGLLLGGCSDDEDFCATASDYVWYVDYFAGSHDGPPPEDQFEPVMSRLVELADTLATEVPDEHRDDARTAHETWVTGYDLFDEYDFSSDQLPDDFGAQLEDAVGDNQGSNEQYVDWLRDECGGDASDWPTEPSQSPN
jgi:hypothetical protein